MKIIQSNLLNTFSNLIHGFTTKEVGNIAFHVSDALSNVKNNHENLAKILKYDKNSLVHMKQIHSSLVHIVSKEDNFTNPRSCDALITDKPGTPLMVMVADCSPILFYDVQKKVIAVAHAGRQGAFKNIIQNTIDSMHKEFHSNTSDIYVSIGASIGVCCYEVGSEIYDEAEEIGLLYALQKKENSHYLDISEILKKQLFNAGVKEENIEISKECTCCLNSKYYSYRAQAQTGRFAGVIMLK
ncbi:MAG: peptidoglycan editing factor PgeF [Helicobacteraceae bacterium]|nr:peptidoglycan editing factor PgeF [Candidatus Sulfurimonas ponti]